MSTLAAPTETPRQPIRVMLVDDHQVIRQAMVRLLSVANDLALVAECSDGFEALQTVTEVRPDVVVMDLSMPGMGGVEAIEKMRHELPNLGVLVMSMHHDRKHLRGALHAGARGFLSKQVPADALPRAIRAVAAGYSHVNVPFEGLSLASGGSELGPAKRSSMRAPSGLSERETEVLRMVALGHTNREIAAHLGVSTKSVDTYRSRVFDKLGVRHRKDVLLFALRHGLVS